MPFYSKGDSSFASICAGCVVCFVKQSIKKRLITQEDKSSMLMEGLFSRIFFACLALRLVFSLHFKANERQMPYCSKCDSSFVEY